MSPDKKSYFVWILAGISGLILITLIILVVLGANYFVSSAKNINLNPPVAPARIPPTAGSVAGGPPPKISPYATDSGILKLRSDLQKLRADIDSVDIFESQLSPPNIDLNINIKPQ